MEQASGGECCVLGFHWFAADGLCVGGVVTSLPACFMFQLTELHIITVLAYVACGLSIVFGPFDSIFDKICGFEMLRFHARQITKVKVVLMSRVYMCLMLVSVCLCPY